LASTASSQNRWRSCSGTATAQAPGFRRIHDLGFARLFSEIDRHFQQSLAAEKTLKATPISAWDDLIEKGTMPDAWRPNPLRFHRARGAGVLHFGRNRRRRSPEDAFDLPADSPIFLPAASF